MTYGQYQNPPPGQQPGYGAPPPGPPQKKSNTALIIVLVIIAVVVLSCGGIGLFCAFAAKKGAEEAGKAVEEAVEEIEKETKRKKKEREETARAGDVEVTAKQLWKDYQDNEVAADEKYKGNGLKVTGRVASIDKGIADGIIVRIATGNDYQSIMANMRDSEKERAAKLKKGDAITLLCLGGTMIIKSPVLNHCTFE